MRNVILFSQHFYFMLLYTGLNYYQDRLDGIKTANDNYGCSQSTLVRIFLNLNGMINPLPNVK